MNFVVVNSKGPSPLVFIHYGPELDAEEFSRVAKHIWFVYREQFKDPIASTTGQRP